MKSKPTEIRYSDGTPLEAQLIDPQCNLGPVVKELWRVNSHIRMDVCHMCCFHHSRHQCNYVAFCSVPPCFRYDNIVGFTHFFQNLQTNNNP